MNNIHSLFEAFCSKEHGCTGGQLSVWHHNQEIINCGIGEDGVGLSIDQDSLFAIYCAAKPFLAVLMELLDYSSVLSFDTMIGNVLPDVRPRLRTVTIREILTHRACLIRPSGPEGIVGSAVVKDELLNGIELGPGYGRPGLGAYSEWAGWYVLAKVVERVTGTCAADLVDRDVVVPLGLAGEVVANMPVMTLRDVGRIRCNVAERSGRLTAAVFERTSLYRRYGGGGIGAFATMSGVARFYKAVLESQGSSRFLLGVPGARIRSHLLLDDGERFDLLMQRQCSYVSGFMTRLRSHGFGQVVSNGAFGNLGLTGMTVAFGDPSSDLAVAWHRNGISPGDPDADGRSFLIDAIYDAIEA